MSKEAYLGITFLQEASVFKNVSLVGVEVFSTPGDFFQQFLPNSFKAVRGSFWSELIFYFFTWKNWSFIEVPVSAKIQKDLSKLQPTCPEEQSQETFFSGENSEKVIEF